MIKVKILGIFLLLSFIMIISLLYSSIIFKDRAMTIEEPYENISVNVGNELCSYFYKLGKCILEKKTFNIEPSKYKGVAFFEHLPTSLPYTYDSIYNDLSTYDITNDNFSDKIGDCEVCAWEIVNNHRHYFWKCLKPLIHTIMNDAFEKSELVKNVPYPIIHFRCADTPFIKQNGYNLQRYAFFKEALEKIQAEQFMDVNSIYLMSCSTHMSNKEQQQSCVKYSESLSDYLNSIGYKCKTICNSNIDDFAMLFYAPAVISTSSSYSFMGGFFSNGIFMSSENSNGKCDSCSDWMLYGFNLQHEHVDNYVDYNSVIPLLKV